MGSVRDSLSWFKVFLGCTKEERRTFAELVLDGLRYYRQYNKKDQEWLSDVLEDESRFTLWGVAPNIEYGLIEGGDAEMMEARFVHAWGIPTLVYKHNKLPIIILMNPAMRLNETVLNEVSNPKQDDLMGFTG